MNVPATVRSLVLIVGLLLGCLSCSAAEDREPDGEDPAVPLVPLPDGSGDGRDGGTLRFGLSADPVSIDPRFLVDDEGELVIDALFDPLVRIDDQGRPRPHAAEAVELSDDARQVTIDLREATFHDGTAVTAEDVARTFNRIADGTAEPRSFLAYLLANIEGFDESQRAGVPLDGVTVVGERTLTIDLSTADPGFLKTLADPSLVPTPPQADEDLDAYGEQPIGNGPFAMAGPREPGEFIRLVAHTEHRHVPLLDEVLFTVYPASGAGELQWQDLQDGTLHVGRVAPGRRQEAIDRFGRSRDGYRGPGLLDGIRSTLYLYGFETTTPPFDDPRLRRAISLAIDRRAIADEVTQGSRAPADALLPPVVDASRNGSCFHCRHDPEAARTLLLEVAVDLAARAAEDGEDADPEGAEEADEAEVAALESDGDGDGDGEEDGQAEDAGADAPEEGEEEVGELTEEEVAELIGPVILHYNRGVYHGPIAEQMANDIQDALGLQVSFQGQELGGFLRDVRAGAHPLFRLGWDVTEPTALAYLVPLFHSEHREDDNVTNLADDEVDRLLDDATATRDDALRRDLIQQAEDRILDLAPVVPVLWYRHDHLVRPEVRDLELDPFGRTELHRVWLDPDVQE